MSLRKDFDTITLRNEGCDEILAAQIAGKVAF